MSALVRVFDHPYFARPDAVGRFVIAGVPSGRHRIVAWHERVGERTLTVRVEAGQTATVNLTVPVEDQP